ncbi:NAD(P)-binding domain-containing protein [Dactylosporangium sp. CS-033363]|uniref:NAD(P)-binding domain-containing protein n=1 Tax=Dactylosporangium sp. CS-033363 TaxID=3239935 RepID=UPI003D936C97
MNVVIGLGNIGIAMAERLVAQGRAVLGVDLAEARRAEWHARTGLDAADALEAVPWERVAHVLIVVRLTEQAEAVLQALRDLPVAEGAGVLVATTLDLAYARGLGRYDDRAWRLIELPVSGGDAAARTGGLTLMLAGRHDARDDELLADLGTSRVPFAEFGQPTLAKLLNNVSAAYTAASYAEMMLLARAAGMSPQRLRDVLHTSSGGSWMGDNFLNPSIDLLAKDVDLLRSQVGALPVVDLNAGLLDRLRAGREALAP